MTVRPTVPAPASPAATEAEPAAEHDRCHRCGRPTPLGVGLCEACNPAQLGGPSATQVHGTIVAAVGLGFAGLALIGRLLLIGVGPFPARIAAATLRADGGVDVTLNVTNGGNRTAPATCRLTRGGVNSPDDLLFLSEPIRAGETLTVSRQARVPDPDQPAYRIDRLAISCT